MDNVKSSEQSRFVALCCSRSGKLFSRPSSELFLDFSVGQWYAAYAAVCADYYEQIFGQPMSAEDRDRIYNSMFAMSGEAEEAFPGFDEERLQRMLKEYVESPIIFEE